MHSTKLFVSVIIVFSIIFCLTACGSQQLKSNDLQPSNEQPLSTLPQNVARFAEEDGYIYNGYSVFEISRFKVIDNSHIRVEPIIIHEDGTYTVNEERIQDWNFYVYSDEAWEMNDGNSDSYMFKPEYQAENNSFAFYTSDNQIEWPISLVLMGKTMFDKFAKVGFNSNYLRENLFDGFDSHVSFWSSISNDTFEDVDSSFDSSSDVSSGALNATNCWSMLADEEGYVYSIFDGSFCAMKKKDSSHIVGFRINIEDDGNYEINYNTETEWYYEMYDNSTWSMSDGLSQKLIYETEYADETNQYIKLKEKNDNEDLFLMNKNMLNNYLAFEKLCRERQAEWLENDDWGSLENQISFWNYIKDGNISKDSFVALITQVFGSEAANEFNEMLKRNAER